MTSKRSIYPQRSDHWIETPRYEGKFASEQPTAKKPITFKIAEDLMQQLEELAIARQRPVNLIVKDFVIAHFDQLIS